MEENVKKINVKMAPNETTHFFEPLLKNFKSLFNRQSIFTSDQSTLLMTISDGLPGILGDKEKSFIIQEIKNASGVLIEEKHLHEELKDFLPWFSKQKYSFNSSYKLNKFLGIRKISDHNNDRWHLSYFFGIKQSYEHLKGFTMGKDIPQDTKSSWNSILEEVETMHGQLFDINNKIHYIIETIEGDSVLCNNMSEVCCWVTARGSNYSQSGKKQDW